MMSQVSHNIVLRNDLLPVLLFQVFQVVRPKVFGMVQRGHQAVMRVLILEKYNVRAVLY